MAILEGKEYQRAGAIYHLWDYMCRGIRKKEAAELELKKQADRPEMYEPWQVINAEAAVKDATKEIAEAQTEIVNQLRGE